MKLFTKIFGGLLILVFGIQGLTAAMPDGTTGVQGNSVNSDNPLDPPTNVTAQVFNEVNVQLNWLAPGGGVSGSILCVDRDGSNPVGALGFTDDWQFIQPVLDNMGVTYDYFEVEDLTMDGPDLATMQQYDIIFWFTGESWQNNQTMTDNDESNLASYLDGGGALLLSGHDYLYDRFPSAGSFTSGQFPYDYLGVGSAVQDNWNVFSPDEATVAGSAGSFANGISFNIADIYTTDKDGLYIDKLTPLTQGLLDVTNPAPSGTCAVQFDGGSFRTAFTTASLAAATDAAELQNFLTAAFAWLSPGEKSSKDLLGYNIYRDGENIDYVTTTSYQDLTLSPGTYEYCITAVYDEGESEMVCADPVTISMGNMIFFDDFEAYTAGQQLACQNPDDWTTWSNLPCDATEDGYISDSYAYSGSNSVVIVQNNDQVKNLDTYFTSGAYSISLMGYVPSGADGYYNVMSDFDGGYEWAFEVYFNADGSGSLNAGGTGAATFTFPFDTWFMSEVKVNLDGDWAEYYLDGEMIYGWQWSLGAAGGGSQLQLAAVDIFGANATTEFYFDDFKIELWEPPTLPAPTNLTGPYLVTTGSDIVLEWDEPSLGATLQWDNGINDNSIGLTSGGTFAVASHWEPADLSDFDGMMLESIAFFAGDYPGASFVLKVWTGAEATEVLSQTVPVFVPNDWNDIQLDNPVMIDASQDLWFGYETTHAAGEYPAGIDAGPAVQGYGDMIYNAGAWSSLYVLTGGALDGNWNLMGTATIGDGSESVVIGNTTSSASAQIPLKNSGTFAAQGYGSGKKYVPAGNKGLLGYNVYRDGANIGNTTETTYTDVISVSGSYTYYVTAVYDNGESMPSNDWGVDVITGVEEQAEALSRLFPNPATSVVNIVSDQNIDNITVYNFAGQKLIDIQPGVASTTLTLDKLSEGVYVVEITSGDRVEVHRLIIR
ncbi:MAG: hypothetical protein Kow00127_24930 [Bacteroidales bacterium]